MWGTVVASEIHEHILRGKRNWFQDFKIYEYDPLLCRERAQKQQGIQPTKCQIGLKNIQNHVNARIFTTRKPAKGSFTTHFQRVLMLKSVWEKPEEKKETVRASHLLIKVRLPSNHHPWSSPRNGLRTSTNALDLSRGLIRKAFWFKKAIFVERSSYYTFKGRG
jgi:hypothetical protein